MRPALRTAALCLALCVAPAAASADADLAAIVAELDARIAATPADPALWQQRSALERRRGNLERAGADLSRAEALGLPAATAGRDRGLLRVAAGSLPEAEALLRSARASSPRDVTILLPHARVLAALSRHREAADTYDALVMLAPDASPDVHLERIRALEALGPGSADEALRAADAAIALRGAVPALEQAALDVALRAGRTDLAVARLSRMAAGSRRPETHLVQMASVLERAGRLDEAAAAYGAALGALEGLPPQRRETKAAAALGATARAGIARIAERSAPPSTAAAARGAAR